MFGISSFGIWSVYLLCIISTIICVVYGILNWNKGTENEDDSIKEEIVWEKDEVKIDENL